MKILIVDDSNDKIAKIVSVIKSVSENFNIDTVNDSISAQINLQKYKYDLLILDLLLPIRFGQNPVPNGGLLLLKEIKRNKKIKPPTLIVGITQYEEYSSHFSSIWKLLFYKNEQWIDELMEIIQHTERSGKYQSEKPLIKPSIFVEGETDAVLLKESINLYCSQDIDKIDVKFQKSGGANWVANQIVAWAVSQYKGDNGELIKSVGLLDGDQAGVDANKEVNRVIMPDCKGASSFKIIKLKPNFATGIIPLYQKGLTIPVALEELYPASFWKYASIQNWLEERHNLDRYIKDPKQWNKMNQSLNEFIDSLSLKTEERIYLNQFKMSSKEKVVKYIISLDDKDKKSVLENFEKLTTTIMDYLLE